MKKPWFEMCLLCMLITGCQPKGGSITAITLEDSKHYTPVSSAIAADPKFLIPSKFQVKQSAMSLIHAPNIHSAEVDM